MSRYWENVLWQNEAGKWGIGFYKRIDRSGFSNGEYDSEWEDDFDTSAFHFASTGHPTSESACQSWRGANPGHNDEYRWSKKDAKVIAEFEDMAKACNNPAYAAERTARLEKDRANKFRLNLRNTLREKSIGTGTYNVRISRQRVVDGYGLSVSVTGTLYQEGDWLLIKFADKGKTVVEKVWNTKTRTQGTKIVGIEQSRSTYRW